MRRSITSMWTLVLVGALVCVATAAAQSGNAGASAAKKATLLWATVNVCDTVAHPDTIGIRGSMPGSGDPAERMFMRFKVQYLSAKDAAWHSIGPTGDTGFIPVGSGRYRARQSGRYFTIRPPATGSFFLRGLVSYEWRVGGEVIRTAHRRTTAGHPRTSGADPTGYTASSCEIKR